MQKETVANPKVAEKLKDLHKLVLQTQEERSRSLHTLSNISKTHERIKEEGKVSAYHKKNLSGLYKTALQDGNSEKEKLKAALKKIEEIRANRGEKATSKNAERPKETLRRGALMKMLQQRAITLPLWIESKRKSPPPLCGAIPADSSYVAKVGDMVAALVKASDGDGDENWILAEVTNYSHNTNKYEVEDIDEEQKEKHVLSRRRVIPLPLNRANPATNPEALFAKETLVLALYPQTTCFYRAVVHEPPSRPTDDYQVLFEDNSYHGGYSPAMAVAQRYVLCYKEGRKKL